MKPIRQLLPTLIIVLAVLLLGSMLPLANVLGQDGQPPAAQDAASPDAVNAALGTTFTIGLRPGAVMQSNAPGDAALALPGRKMRNWRSFLRS